MNWLEVAFDVKHHQVEQGIALLEDLGAQAVSLYDAKDQPIFEPPPGQEPILWEDSILVGLMDKDCPLPNIKEKILSMFPQSSISTKSLEEQNWVKIVQSQFPPKQFGQLWIVPSWAQAPADEHYCIHLDPGMAFGTGTHATTHLCLDWIAQHAQSHQTVIDYGCGSGILSLAAAKMGAKRIYGVDYDPQAIQASDQNRDKNHISEAQLTNHLPQDTIIDEVKADLVIANILAGPLLSLRSTLVNFLNPGADIVLSGILESQQSDLIAAYMADVEILDTQVKDGWCLIHGRAKQVTP